MHGGVEELSRTGTEDKELPICDRIAYDHVKLPDVPLELLRDGGLVTEGIAHPVPPRD